MRRYDDFHKSILVEEINESLITNKHGVYIDCTAGEGGHSSSLFEYCETKARIIAVDIDYEVLEIAEKRAKEKNHKIEFFKAPYQDIDLIIRGLGIEKVDGFLMDLGVSTFQLKAEGRGFSFQTDEPLDMRMDTDNNLTASMVLNQYNEKDLSRIIFEFGQEFKYSRKIARNIVNSRPLNSTFDLKDAIKKSLPSYEIRKRKRHYATKTFQAIRIEVNQEFENIKKALDKFTDLLKPGGRICILTFHSLEDRIIKHYYKDNLAYEFVTKKPILPSEEEIRVNPRSRSAKLRVVELKK